MSPPGIRRTPRALGRDWLGALGARAAAVVLAVVVNGLITRALEPSDAGSLFLAISVGQGLALVALVGSQRVVVRDVSRSLALGDHRGVRDALGRHGSAALLGTVITAAILITPVGRRLLEPLWPTTLGRGLGLAVAAIVVMRALGLFRAETLRATHRVTSANLLTGVDANLLFGIVLAVSLTMPGHLSAAAGAGWYAAAWVPGLVLSTVVIRRWLGPSAPEDRGSAASFTWGDRWPFWITTLTGFALTQGDLWLAGAFLGPVDVARYAAALRLVLLATLPLQVVNGIVLPRIVDLHARGERADLERLLRGTAAVAVLPSLVVVIAFIVAGGPILRFVYGDPTYAAAWGPLVVLSLGQLVHVIAGSCGALLQMTGHERANMTYGLIGAAVLVGTAPVLVSLLGPIGIALASATAVVVNNSLMWRRARDQLGIRTHPSRPRISAVRELLQVREGSGVPADVQSGD